jgi:hypothetical protein
MAVIGSGPTELGLSLTPAYCAPPPEPVADGYDGGGDYGYQRGPHYGGG